MAQDFTFRLHAQDRLSKARAGSFSTPHGNLETPVFMPVGTQATVKSMAPRELIECNSSIILANTYHLHLRPTDTLIRDCGGLHKFENWDRAILTDSGGFQVFSLKDISKITDDGVWFQSHLDGSKHFFSPESVIQIQHNLGADIIMAFDECPSADADDLARKNAVRRTIQWAAQCREVHAETPFHFGYQQALFGITQGGINKELRKKCTTELVAMDFPGYAIGGLAVGENIESMYDIAEYNASLLPCEKPRYLMGVGMPGDILACIARGIDMFDCVIPTRNGRNGCAFTWDGKINLRNACHAGDFQTPIDSACSCYACSGFSRAYIRHCIIAGEILGIRLVTLHNIYFFIDLVRKARSHILEGTFTKWKDTVLHALKIKNRTGMQ
ncbi:MAG: tRNA guanosine(34) transglycosylase Tgt [Chitinivibrionales bacterium]|nr:tRNA guanosine(34) transglycosylase Tgt [Chitinivibrionales bacterium]